MKSNESDISAIASNTTNRLTNLIKTTLSLMFRASGRLL